MKARPILFSAPMIRALLAGTKTQTRRAINPQPYVDEQGNACWNGIIFGQDARGEPLFWSLASPLPSSRTKRVHCPYGASGDLLWVRESFWGCDLAGYGDQPCVVYDDEWTDKEYRPSEPRPWARKFGRIPSIHMPRDDSRLTLRITHVRVQRLQDISEEDAKAEGAEKHNSPADFLTTHRMGFRELWESINGPGSWDANPWVWALTFEVIKKNVDEVLKELAECTSSS